MNNLRYPSRVTSAVRHESLQLWVDKDVSSRYDEQVQRKMAFKRLKTWCFLKNIALWKLDQYIRRKSICIYDQSNVRGLKIFWFFNSPINWGKNLIFRNTDCNYLSPGHRCNTLVKNLPNRQSTPIPFWNQCENHCIDVSSDKRRQQKFLR